MKKKINVICLPFAGGNKYSYRAYEKVCPSHLKIITLNYPGRGSRIQEQLLTSIDNLVNDLFAQVKTIIATENYAIYGHSMGGLLTYLLTKKILKSNYPMPIHLFVSGCTGPSAFSRQNRNKHLLSKEELINEIIRLDGCPDEILNNIEMLEFIEPIIRADFQTIGSYRYEASSELSVPITVLNGTEEEMDSNEINLWQKETVFDVDFRVFPGKHFFILQHFTDIINVVSENLVKTNYRLYD